MAATPITAADYRGEVVDGKRWRRIYRVLIDNPYGGTARVQMDEEEVTDIEDVVKARPTAVLTCTVDMEAVIPLYNPETGERIPNAEMTHQEVYVALYSLYRQLGALRDAAEGV